MNGWNAMKIIALLKECGDIAMQYYENPPFELKADHSVVTAADKAIEQRLALEFDHPEAGSYMIGEETIDTHNEAYIQAAFKGNAWVVDPIDGTAPYSIHCPLWGISIAYMEKLRIKEGAIFFPALGEMIYTDGPDSWLLTADGKRVRYPFGSAPLNNSWPISLSQSMIKNCDFTFSNHIVVWDSAVAVFAYLLRGRVLGYVANLKLWDVAACLAFTERGEFVSRDYHGNSVSCNIGDSFYLDSESQKRWFLRNTTIFAANNEALEYILNYTSEGKK